MFEQQTILIVDDEWMDRSILTELLKNDYRLILAKNGEQAVHKAAKYLPDLILLDVVLPDISGYEVQRRLREQQRTRHLAVAFITSQDSADDEAYGISLGAYDYITKPFHLAVVKARIANILRLERQRALLEKLASLDGLTEVHNRRKFDEILIEEFHRCASWEAPLSMAMLDVDHFKAFNDCYGHGKGDDVLKLVARCMRVSVPLSSGYVARYGGEEFVMLMPGVSEQDSMGICRQTIQLVQDLNVPHEKSTAADVLTVSIGGVTVFPSLEESPSRILRQADFALYSAKKAGRNRILWYTECAESAEPPLVNQLN
ncbi:diguanylate cyclase [Leeia sp. TBRC 13508]|uniref:diguanylate cyclase n=1 Tax=Leeia speluncae TaxID=2884804 RepID=A0ABS8D7K7_9NEIS|nr:diguanylate cyclase [Leeia speluncae]MCB6184179.1 diguanylate cyclase [Leeia speluncae]